MTTTTQNFPSSLAFSSLPEIISNKKSQSTDCNIPKTQSSSFRTNKIMQIEQLPCTITNKKQKSHYYFDKTVHNKAIKQKKQRFALMYESITLKDKINKATYNNNCKNSSQSTAFLGVSTALSISQQQQEFDCGSSSGLGETNDCSPNSSSLDSDSRDSGACATTANHKTLNVYSTLTSTKIITDTKKNPLFTITLPLTTVSQLFSPVLNNGLSSNLNSFNMPHLINSYLLPSTSIVEPLPLSQILDNKLTAQRILPQTLSHFSSMQPLYTMTCQAAVVAAATAAAAGYQVSCGTDNWFNSATANNNLSLISKQKNNNNFSNQTNSETVTKTTLINKNSILSNTLNNNLPPSIPSCIAAAANSGHDLFVHVQAGDAISLAVGQEIQLIPGPATIRMVSQSTPLSALPMNVPQGHIVQQLLDRQGILSHIIMSQENSMQIINSNQTLSNTSNSDLLLCPMSTTTSKNVYFAQNLSLPAQLLYQKNSINTPISTTHQIYLQHQTSQHNYQTSSKSNFAQTLSIKSTLLPPNACNEYFVNINTNHTSLSQQKLNNLSNFNKSMIGVINNKQSNTTLNSCKSNLINTTKLEFDMSQPSALFTVNNKNDLLYNKIEEDEWDCLKEALNNMQPPEIIRIGTNEVDISWQELDTSEAAASGGPFPQIDASEFTYEIFVYEDLETSKCIIQHQTSAQQSSCNLSAITTNNVNNAIALTTTSSNSLNNILCLKRLKPGTDYFVNIRASLLKKRLCGNSSSLTKFRTHSCQPDPPKQLKLLSRISPAFVILGWKAGACNGSSIISYKIQVAKNKSENFENISLVNVEQYKLNLIDVNAYYRIRIIALNEFGESEPSQTLNISPSVIQTQLNNQVMHFHYQRQNNNGFSHRLCQQNLQNQKLAPPFLVSFSSQNIRLSYNISNKFTSYTIEMCDVKTNQNVYNPIPVECYVKNDVFVNISNLQSNREYRFRLVGKTTLNEIMRSNYLSVKTYDEYNENLVYNQNYQQQQKSQLQKNLQFFLASQQSEKEIRIPPPTNLQKLFDDNNLIEIGWKYNNCSLENILFVVEATNNFNDDNQEKLWKVFYCGISRTIVIHDSYVCAFRVKALNSRRQASSSWSDVLIIRRTNQQQKRLITNQQESFQKAQQQIIQKEEQPFQQNLLENINIEEKRLKIYTDFISKPPNCTVPKFINITSHSAKAHWKFFDQKINNLFIFNSIDKNKKKYQNFIFCELQRVDKKPPIKIYSGNKLHFELINLSPSERVQLQVRSVFCDLEGNQWEGDWSEIGSACTLCATTTPPQNLRICCCKNEKTNNKSIQFETKSNNCVLTTSITSSASTSISTSTVNSLVHCVPNVLNIQEKQLRLWLSWDAPLQLNGSNVIEYLIYATEFTINENNSLFNNKNELLTITNKEKCIGSTIDTFFLIEKLLPSKKYIFNVVALNKAGKSEKSNCLEYCTPALAPNSPKNFHAEPLSTTKIKLSWDAAECNGSPITLNRIFIYKLIYSTELSINSYKVLLQEKSDKYYIRKYLSEEIVQHDKTSLIFDNLEADTSYEFFIEAQNAIGKSLREKTFCTTLPLPPNPPILNLVEAFATVIKLKWTNATGKNEPNYYYLDKEIENGIFLRIYEGELHSTKIKGLKEHSIYRFRIRAALTRNSIASSWSSIYEFSTTRQPPANLKTAPFITELNAGIYQVEWQPLRLPHIPITNNSESLAKLLYQPDQQKSQLIYRLQIASKFNQDKTVLEPWHTAYEGTATMCTVKLGVSSFYRQARVFVVQKWFSAKNDTDSIYDNKRELSYNTMEESISASSPITIFPPSHTISNDESILPKKRLKLSKNSASDLETTFLTNLKRQNFILTHSPKKIGFLRWLKRSILSFKKKKISEKDCALIFLVFL